MPTRRVIKEGYLNKIKEGRSLLKKRSKRWYILVLVNGLPVLEYYSSREESMVRRPEKDYNLSSGPRIIRNLSDQEKKRFNFVILFESRQVTLEASTLNDLEDWVSCLNSTVEHFSSANQENAYGSHDVGEMYDDLDDARPNAKSLHRTESAKANLKNALQVELPYSKGSCTVSSDSSTSSTCNRKRDAPLPGLPDCAGATASPPEREESPIPPTPPPRVPAVSPEVAAVSPEIPEDWSKPFEPFFPTSEDPEAMPALPPLPPRDPCPAASQPQPPHAQTSAPTEDSENVYGTTWDENQGAVGGDAEDVYGCAWEENGATVAVPNGVVKDEVDVSARRMSSVEKMIRQLDTMSARMSKLDLYLHHSGVPQNTAVEEIEEDVYDRLESKLEAMEEWNQLAELRTRRNQSAHNVFKPNPDPPPFDASKDPVMMAGFFEKKVGIRGAGEMVDHKSVKDGMLTVQRTATSSSTNSLFITAGPDVSLSALAGAVESVKKQILSPGGIAIRIQVKDIRDHVAFLEVDNRVWVAGWSPTAVRLHHSLHIGDQVMGVNDRVIPIESMRTFWKIIDALPSDETRVNLRLRRLPYAKIVAIRRDREGQQLDLVRVGGTNEISFIKHGGLTYRHGLPTLCKNFNPADCGFKEGNWFLTEVNGRTLNMFYKNNEVEVALNAYGIEISIVVQPADFVKKLKKALKPMKKYKGFVGNQ